MAGNSFGKWLRLHSFGESHGAAMGGILDGMPAGVNIDLAKVQHALDRRRPGQSNITTQRKESDQLQILSGLFEGQTLGTPIGFIIPNQDAKSKDYDHLKGVYRPSHADRTYQAKYGHRDHRGGGRASARETVSRVVAGALAAQVAPALKFVAFVSSVGPEDLDSDAELNYALIDQNPVRCPHGPSAERFENAIRQARKDGDSLGGIITARISQVPAGLGEPAFDKLHADLAKAMLSINAVKGFEIGSGFAGSRMRGSAHNDLITSAGNRSNNAGGVEGGITNGEEIVFRVAFKPVATIMRDQESVNEAGQPITVAGKGRHDPCVVPRAVPIVEAMAQLTIIDHLLRRQADRADSLKI